MKSKKIEVFMSGGLGNQLFQFWHGFKLKDSETELVLNKSALCKAGSLRDYSLPSILNCDLVSNLVTTDSDGFGGNFFRLANNMPSFAAKMLGIINDSNYELSEPNRSHNRLAGYFQSADLIPSRSEVSNFFKDFDHYSIDKDCVGIHVRRGDYLIPSHSIHGCISIDVIVEQIRHIPINPRNIFIFSDSDIKSEMLDCINSFSASLIPKLVFVENLGLSDAEQFLLMREMSHLICSNSTYSWWAGYSSANVETIFLPAQWYSTKRISDSLIFDGAVLYEC